MPQSNTRASYIDVTLHQAARRDALAMGHTPLEKPDPRSLPLNDFLWTVFGILCVLILIFCVRPAFADEDKTEPSCEAPGEGHGTGQWCHYQFKIVKIDFLTWTVQGVIPGGDRIYYFRVHELDKVGLRVGTVYHFSGQDDSPYLEPYPLELQ